MSTPEARARQRLGGALLVLGPVVYLLAHLVTQSAWSSPRYSWSANYISDLGATTCGTVLGNVVCSPLHPVMNTAFVVQGLALALGVVLTRHWWPRGWAATAARVLLVLTGLSWVVVGLVPEDVSLAGHSVGALPVFTLSNVALLLVGVSRGVPVVLRAFAGALGAVGVVGFGLLAVVRAHPGVLSVGTVERLAVNPHQLWVVLAGAAVLASTRQRHP